MEIGSTEPVVEQAQAEEVQTEQAVQQVEIVETPEQSDEEMMMEFLDNEEGLLSDESTEDLTIEPEVEPEEESETDVDEVPEDEIEEGEPDVDEVSINTLNDAAEALGVDVADLYKLEIPVTLADGETRNITLGEYKDQIQTEVYDMVKGERDKFKTKLNEAKQKFQQDQQVTQHQNQISKDLLIGIEQNLVTDINKVNWKELEQTDPTEYANQIGKYDAKVKQLDNYKQQLYSNHQQAIQANTQQQQQEFAQRKEVERTQLLKKLPNWTDNEKAKVEMAEVSKYLVEDMGYNPNEVGSAIDHRFIVMAEKARQYDKMKQATPTKKRVVKIGKKTIKPGPSKSKRQVNASNKKSLQSKAIKSGSDGDLQAYFESIL